MPLPRTASLHTVATHWARDAWRAWLAWWQLLRFGAQILVLALSPSSHRRGQRHAVARALYAATRPLLTPFTVLSALVAVVVIRIVLASAQSYGLVQYALDVLVRTLVLELIPLSAALFVAVRYSLAAGDALRGQRARGEFDALRAAGHDPARDLVLPRVLAGMFAVFTLALVSGVLTLLLTYLSLYGLSSWGLAGFTRTVGQVIGPVIALIFLLKTLFFSLAVSIIPMVEAAPGRRHDRASREQDDLARLARMLAVLLLVEVASLIGNYY